MAGFFCSCEDFLEVDPKGKVLSEELFTSAKGFEDALVGVYAELSDKRLYGMELMIAPELLSQNFTSDEYSYGDFDMEDDYMKVFLEDFWTKMYENISYVNNILENHNYDIDTTYADLYKGEALGLRAYMHFELLNYFGPHISVDSTFKAIPYVTDYAFVVRPFLSVSEVYKHIIEDLSEAERLLAKDESLMMVERSYSTGEFGIARETHFNLYAAQAMLARVYWMKGDLDKAAFYARKVIESNKFQFEGVGNVRTMVAGVLNFEETIWGVFENSQSWFNAQSIIYPKDSYPSLEFSNGFQDEYTSDDQRQLWFKKRYPYPWNRTYCLYKLYNTDREDQGSAYSPNLYEGINLIRIPEMYFIMAEYYLLEESNAVLATKYVDDVLKARGVSAGYEDISQVVSLDIIDLERNKEFIGEGHNWMVIKKRSKLVGPVTSVDEYIMPIPESEIEYRN